MRTVRFYLPWRLSKLLPSAGVMLSALLSVMLVGCGGNSGQHVFVETVEGLAGDDVSTSGLGESGESEESGETEGDIPRSDLLLQRVIYFDYNSSLLSSEGKAVAQAHAEHLNQVADVKIILEGHSDERGTREYNLALGEARARAVINLMQALGVSANRIETVSYGEERPVVLGHDDGAWGLNRRVEILYP